MRSSTEPDVIELMPRASVMIEAMRDIGYSFDSAVADIIDNSIAAGAQNIDLRYGWVAELPWIAIIDDGAGMNRDDLLEAMRPGSKDPRLERLEHDLGRFGLGLKTASFSQCRELTVISRCGDELNGMRWDLDRVAATNRWEITEIHTRCLSTELSAFLNGRCHFFWRPHMMLPWWVQPDLFDVLPVACLP